MQQDYQKNPVDKINDQNRIQHRVQYREKNPENNIKKIEDPGAKGKKHQKTRKIKVEIAKTEPHYREEYENELKYYDEKTKSNKTSLSNVSFSNKNIDTKTFKSLRSKKPYDPNLNNNYKTIDQLDSNLKIQELERQKELLTKENKKLYKNIHSLKREKEKLKKEKKLFLESKERVINDYRKNEERLISLENELQTKFMRKKQEIEEMRNKLKEEQNFFENERNTMRNSFQTKLQKLEEDYKKKEENQNYNNNLNIEK